MIRAREFFRLSSAGDLSLGTRRRFISPVFFCSDSKVSLFYVSKVLHWLTTLCIESCQCVSTHIQVLIQTQFGEVELQMNSEVHILHWVHDYVDKLHTGHLENKKQQLVTEDMLWQLQAARSEEWWWLQGKYVLIYFVLFVQKCHTTVWFFGSLSPLLYETMGINPHCSQRTEL